MQAILLTFTSIKRPTGRNLQRETIQMVFLISLSGQVSQMEKKLSCSTLIFVLCVSWTHQIWTKMGESIVTSDKKVHALIINALFNLQSIVSNLFRMRIMSCHTNSSTFLD